MPVKPSAMGDRLDEISSTKKAPAKRGLMLSRGRLGPISRCVFAQPSWLGENVEQNKATGVGRF
jgi:hypothetical protein